MKLSDIIVFGPLFGDLKRFFRNLRGGCMTKAFFGGKVF